MERYEIIIQDKRTKKPTNVSGEDEKKKTNVSGQDENDKEEGEKNSRVTAFTIAKMAISEARSLVVVNIGEFARDSLLQSKIDETLDVVDTITSFAIHPVYGAINLATKSVSKGIQFAISNQKETTRLAEAMRRASYVNRSRE